MTLNQGHIRPLVAGNWKMNGLRESFPEAIAVAEAVSRPDAAPVDVMICPPQTMLMVLNEVIHDHKLMLGGQDCHAQEHGAHTGDVSALMLKDAGASAVIVGHSEQRSDHGELDRHVLAKAKAAHAAGLTAIICIGETAGERSAGLTLEVVTRQLAGSVPDSATAADTVIAYEPVWAIGTGVTPTLEDVGEVHSHIRSYLKARFGAHGETMRLLYGGSVKPDNAKTLMGVANVNGALVGGASLKAQDFLAIVAAYKDQAGPSSGADSSQNS